MTYGFYIDSTNKQPYEPYLKLCRREAPQSMAELTVKYRLDADGLQVKDLVTERDFLALRLGIPEHLLQVLSWGQGSIMVTYWMLQDVLPFAELALCREDVRAELIQHGVEAVYLDSYLSHLCPVSSRALGLHRKVIHGTPSSFNVGGPSTANYTL